MIITLDLSLKRGDKILIEGLNLHIEKGDFVLICGQAGSGKTSLLRLLAVKDLPAVGRVIIDGRDSKEIPRREYPAYWRTLGVVFQDDMLLANRTIGENIEISLELAGWSPGDAAKETTDCIKKLGLRTAASRFPHDVSENERKLAKICRALARRPKIVLADEPFDGLDSDSVSKAMELLDEANLRGSTIAITTHNVELAGRLNKRAIMLDRTSFGRMKEASAF